MPSGLLFSRVSVFNVLQHQEQTLRDEVSRLDATIIQSIPQEDLVHRLAGNYKLELPVLVEEKAYVTHRETKVDVSRDPFRILLDWNSSPYIKGTEITVHVPFRGDPNIFEVQPTTYNLNPPRGQVDGNEIWLIYTRTDNNAAAVTTEYQRDVQQIKQYLEWLGTSVADFNGRVGQQVQNLISRRRQQLADVESMVAAIGLPVRQTTDPAGSGPPLRATVIHKGISSRKKWDVFISHASEDKDELARPLAEALQTIGLAVWYDEFSLKMGDSLRTSIDYGLANSRYGVVILSNNFFAKHWPVQELNGLASREVNRKKVILPIWHNVTAEEVREFSPILADRLASSSDAGLTKLVEDIMEVLEQD